MTRRRAIAAGLLLALLGAIAATAAPARQRPAELGRMAADGAVKVTASGSHAILTASGLRPGQSVGGNVALANVGDARGRLTLLRTGMVDTPGRFGGRLSGALLLRVEELGGGSWTGPLAGPEALDLGIMEPGEGRSYRLTLTLPDTGPGGHDNAVQGSSVTIDWAWRTESTGPAVDAPTPTSTPTATPAPGTATPSTPPTAAPQAPQPRRGAPRLDLRIPHQRVLTTRGISMYGSCDRPCRVSFRARIQTSPRGRGRSRTLQRAACVPPAGRRPAAAEHRYGRAPDPAAARAARGPHAQADDAAQRPRRGRDRRARTRRRRDADRDPPDRAQARSADTAVRPLTSPGSARRR